MAAIFLYSGYGKLTGISGFAGYLANHGLPFGTYPLAILAGIVEIGGGLALLIGFGTRYAALLLAFFTLVAALIGHRFWEIADPGQRSNQLIHFWKNIAIIGGFLALYAAGPGVFSVDRRR
ncbi:MAG: DoxX family protein [Beijerinckiaceae bacterium]